jgi:acyl-CoA thioesterase-1
MVLCANEDLKTILVVGDSLSTAYGINPEKGWVSLMEKRIQESHLPYQVVNISTGGDTTSDGVEKLPKALKRYHPAIVILALGSNDGLQGIQTTAIQNNLKQMIEFSKKNGSQTLLVGFLIPLNYGSVYRRKFEDVFINLANIYHLPRIPFLLKNVALNPELMQEDALHPNEAGQPIILDTVWTYLNL